MPVTCRLVENSSRVVLFMTVLVGLKQVLLDAKDA